jgi:hypothetical protein
MSSRLSCVIPNWTSRPPAWPDACDDYRVTVTKADDGAWLNAMGDPRPVNTYSRRAWGMLSGCRR